MWRWNQKRKSAGIFFSLDLSNGQACGNQQRPFSPGGHSVEHRYNCFPCVSPEKASGAVSIDPVVGSLVDTTRAGAARRSMPSINNISII